MRRRPYQSRGDQNKQRINQLEKFDSETAQGESFKLKLWKGRVFTFQEESTFAPTSSPSSEGSASHTNWVGAHSPCGTGFPSQPHNHVFQPPQQKNKSGVSFATAYLAGTEFLNLLGRHSRGGIGAPALEGWPPLHLSISTALQLGVSFSPLKYRT